MPENEPPIPVVSSGNPQPSVAEPQTPFNIGEEYGTAKKNLPPAKIVLIALAILAVVAAVFILAQRPHSEAAGSIDDVVSAEVPGQNSVMVAINVSVRNHGKTSFQIRSIEAALDATGGPFTDSAASAVDFDRYFEALPALKAHALAPLIPEMKVPPQGEVSGTVIVNFPVTADAFANRKSLTVTVQPYDALPLLLKK